MSKLSSSEFWNLVIVNDLCQAVLFQKLIQWNNAKKQSMGKDIIPGCFFKK